MPSTASSKSRYLVSVQLTPRLSQAGLLMLLSDAAAIVVFVIIVIVAVSLVMTASFGSFAPA